MTEERIKELIIRRYARVQNPWVLWQLNLYVQWKRLSWHLVVASASLIKRAFDVFGSVILILLCTPLLVGLAFLVKYRMEDP